MTVIKKKNAYIIDAKNQILGRLASQVALLLRGKQKRDFLPYRAPEARVVVKNIDQIRVTGKKFLEKYYLKHTGYPGHLKRQTLKEIFLKNPRWVFRHAVLGMLPKNKLRNKMIKNLYFE